MPPYIYAVAPSDDSLSIFDLANPALPTLAGSIQGAGAPNFLNSAMRLVVYGNYAYIAVSAPDSGLTIIDVSDPTTLAYTGGIYGAGAPDFLGSCFDVFIGNGTFNGYAYVIATADNGLTIVDINDPSNPVRVGGIYGAGAPPGGNWLSSARGVFVRGAYAYIVSAVDNSFTVINVSDPTNPTLEGSIQGAGAPPWLGDARKVRVKGNYAYVAVSGDDALTVIDITNPAAPAYFGGIRGPGGPNFLDGAYALFLRANLAYVVAQDDDSLSIFNITNPAAPVFVGNIAFPVVFLNAVRGVTISWPYAICAGSANNQVTIIDITNPAAPAGVAALGGGGAPNWMLAVNDVAIPSTWNPNVQTNPATEIT